MGFPQRVDRHLRRRATHRPAPGRPAGSAAHPRPLFSPDYPNASQRPANDLIIPVQRGSADLGAFVAMQSLETLLRATLPAVFTARYSLSVVDADGREVFSNTSVKPTDRRISGSISLDLPNNRLGLNIVAYRGGGAWLPFVPAALIIFLTLVATATLVQLRRHAHHRAETEEKLRAAYAFRQAMSQSMITGLRRSTSRDASPSSMPLFAG
jgi:hypothetical protein